MLVGTATSKQQQPSPNRQRLVTPIVLWVVAKTRPPTHKAKSTLDFDDDPFKGSEMLPKQQRAFIRQEYQWGNHDVADVMEEV